MLVRFCAYVLHTQLIFSVHATCLAYLNLLRFVTLITFREGANYACLRDAIRRMTPEVSFTYKTDGVLLPGPTVH